MNARVYEQITQRIVALLRQGTIPWQKSWKASTDWPRNLVSQKPYRGINVLLLLATSYESPFWLTFRQVLQRGGRIRKGEKSCPVIFWKQMNIEDKKSNTARTIPLLRCYHVFNIAQCENIKASSDPIGHVANDIVRAREIVTLMPQPPIIKHGMARAFYSTTEDQVGMPDRERFQRPEHYYSTLFHELVHCTGHESRLRRSTLTDKSGFGANPYCKEELIAEIGATFLCGQAEIVERTIDNSAAYIQGWLDQLQKDNTLIVQAAAQAQKAADFILANGMDHSGDSETAFSQSSVAEECK